MSQSKFRVIEQQVEDGTREIRVEGELDLAVADQLDQMLEGSTADRTLIDLRGCDFIDSSGIAVILRANIAAQKRGGKVLVHSAQDQVQRVFFVTGLIETGLIFVTREEALAEQAPL